MTHRLHLIIGPFSYDEEKLNMKRIVLTLSLIILTIGFAVNTGCKKSDDSFDITEGSWAFYLSAGSDNSSLVYTFRGEKDQGNVIYNNEVRGSFTVSGTLVNFTVNHYDAVGDLYVYVYTGTSRDYLFMSGSFSVTYPGGSVISGTWSAER